MGLYEILGVGPKNVVCCGFLCCFFRRNVKKKSLDELQQHPAWEARGVPTDDLIRAMLQQADQRKSMGQHIMTEGSLILFSDHPVGANAKSLDWVERWTCVRRVSESFLVSASKLIFVSKMKYSLPAVPSRQDWLSRGHHSLILRSYHSVYLARPGQNNLIQVWFANALNDDDAFYEENSISYLFRLQNSMRYGDLLIAKLVYSQHILL